MYSRRASELKSMGNGGLDTDQRNAVRVDRIAAAARRADLAPPASSSSKARTKLPGGPRRGHGLSQIGRQMPALLSFTFLDLKCGSASSRAVLRA